ncbi:flavodoxin [Flavimarina sp. Hel_I_48]|uniref:flavodoxin n=1 Tax=Flavimarina sp. Hel_I_48 TaxID=1392488 RepID=UPI0004DF7197|nr:flavodoxin [Flavimarina sp. Hel_I_48]
MTKLLAFILMLSSCDASNTKEANAGSVVIPDPDKILIVYLSRTENTKTVAEMIQRKTGGKLVALEKENPYPENYQKIVSQVDQENEDGFLPPLKTKIKNLENYDTVFIGFPTWDMQLPPPMKSFLNENNLSGKTVIPFNTNAGYGLGQSLAQLRSLCLNSEILKEFSVEGGYEKQGVLLAIKGDREQKVSLQVEDWLRAIKILK